MVIKCKESNPMWLSVSSNHAYKQVAGSFFVNLQMPGDDRSIRVHVCSTPGQNLGVSICFSDCGKVFRVVAISRTSLAGYSPILPIVYSLYLDFS